MNECGIMISGTRKRNKKQPRELTCNYAKAWPEGSSFLVPIGSTRVKLAGLSGIAPCAL